MTDMVSKISYCTLQEKKSVFNVHMRIQLAST